MSGTVKLSGPLFDGTAERAGTRGTEAARQRVADEGARLAAATLAASVRLRGRGKAIADVTTTDRSRVYQTGKDSMIITASTDETIVTTDLATYGPWLEGTGSRNQTTRFKGYHSFRLAGQVLDRSAAYLANEAFRPYVREMQ